MQDNEEPTTSTAKTEDPLSRSRRKKKKTIDRKSPRGVKLWLVLLLIIGSGLVGLVVGFSFLGNGSIGQALDIGTYKHMYDLVFKSNP